jgi:hypothetical protein
MTTNESKSQFMTAKQLFTKVKQLNETETTTEKWFKDQKTARTDKILKEVENNILHKLAKNRLEKTPNMYVYVNLRYDIQRTTTDYTTIGNAECYMNDILKHFSSQGLVITNDGKDIIKIRDISVPGPSRCIIV